MRFKSIFRVLLFTLLTAASTSFAQGVGNSGRLPNGKPFQILARAIADVEATLQHQIANLQAQIDANSADIALLTQMVNSLQTAVSQLELRMAQSEASVQALEDYLTAVDALLQYELQQIMLLQQRLNSVTATVNLHTSQINQLFGLHNVQQSAINSLQNSITFLNLQIANINVTNAQQSQQIASLQIQANNLGGQLVALNFQYQTTRNQLAVGCPPNSSIRQVPLGGPVICEVDNGTPMTVPFSATFIIPAMGINSGQVFCPPANPPFVSTGGGASIHPNSTLLETYQSSPTGWRVTARNGIPVPVSARAIVTCTRIQ